MQPWVSHRVLDSLDTKDEYLPGMQTTSMIFFSFVIKNQLSSSIRIIYCFFLSISWKCLSTEIASSRISCKHCESQLVIGASSFSFEALLLLRTSPRWQKIFFMLLTSFSTSFLSFSCYFFSVFSFELVFFKCSIFFSLLSWGLMSGSERDLVVTLLVF